LSEWKEKGERRGGWKMKYRKESIEDRSRIIFTGEIPMIWV
jgi:hypothetical protein